MIGRLRIPGRPLRIAYGRIFHEANAFSPLTTEREDFERFHFFEGAALADRCRLPRPELEGYLRNAELSGFAQAARLCGGVTCVPTTSALAVPNGPLSPGAFDWLKERLSTTLRAAGEVDAVYLALHGSMRVQGLGAAPEGELLDLTRSIVGDEVPLAVSYDLHANLSPALIEPATLVCGYQTNPHRDLFRVGYRAGRALVRAARGDIAPTHAWRKLPIVLGGGKTIDFLAPMRSVFGRLRAMQRDPRVVYASLFMVHPYSDADDLGWAVHVTTDGDPDLAARLADELAERAWAVRKAPLPRMRTAREALDEAGRRRLSRATGAVTLVDVDDIVGTGAPGGNTHLLAELVGRADELEIYVPLHDPAVVEACQGAALGAEVDVILRGTPGLEGQPAVPLRASVEVRTPTDFGRTVRLRRGGLQLVVTERPPLPVHPGFWRAVGLSPWRADALVQKSFFHYRVFYALVNRANVPFTSDGASSLERIRRMRFDLPVWPSDDPPDWRPFDRARRGLSSVPGPRVERGARAGA